MRILKKIFLFAVIIVFSMVWIYSYPPPESSFWKNFGGHGWPRLWQKPPAPLDKYLSGPIPPAVNIAQAATTTIFIASTASTTWTVPSNWNNAANTIEVIGGGGGGGGGKAGGGGGSGAGGGGGAYAKISNLTLTAGGSVTIAVGGGGTGGVPGANGSPGTATFFNGTICGTASVCGDSGLGGLTSATTGAGGGALAGSVGTTKFVGGNGGGGSAANGTSGGGGGGAAGLNGAGNNAAAGPSAGGSGDAGFGGAGGAAGKPAANGGNGTEYDATHGSGGGGGGGNAKAATATGGIGGLFGAGGGGGGGTAAGGAGEQGLIIIKYTPLAATVTCSTNVTSTAFGTLTTGAVSTASPNASTTLTCSGTALGCTLNISDTGLATSSPAYTIASTTGTLAAGTEGWGIQAATTTAGTGGTLTLNTIYNVTGNTVGKLGVSTALASSTVDVTSREVVVTHLAAISATTQAGSYTDTITYSCVAN